MDLSLYSESHAGDLQNLWLQNKRIVNQLYISQNKTLSEVKQVMESMHGFPSLRLHDYEVALREVLKLRKNLKKEDWYTIGVLISNRRRQGKDTEVLWNDRSMPAKKVRKEVLRNRRLSQFRTPNSELPVGLIIRTPPGSPPAEQLAMVPSAGTRSNQERAILLSDHDLPSVNQAGPPRCSVRVVPPATNQLDVSRFRCLREDVPFNRFMSEILTLAQSYPILIDVSSESTWTPGPRLFGGNPSWDMLACLSYQLSNNLEIDWRVANNRWFLDWFSASADFAFLRKLFSVNSPTVYAIYERLCKVALNLYRPALARVLFEIKDAVDNNNGLVETLLLIAVRVGSQEGGMLDLAKRAFECMSPPRRRAAGIGRLQPLPLIAAARRDMAVLRLLAGALTRTDITTGSTTGRTFLLARVMRQLFIWSPHESKDDGTISDYIQLLIQCGILSTGLSARCCSEDRFKVLIENSGSLTVDELVMMCPPTKRKCLYSVVLSWSNEHRLSLTNAGIFTTAVEGTHSLQAYLQSWKQKRPFSIQAILQECLLFAACLNDTTTAAALLQLGADPTARLLSNNRQSYHRGMLSWDPMIVAAAAANLDMLQLLKESIDLASFVKFAPVYEILQGWDGKLRHYGGYRGGELRRLEDLRRHYLHSQTRTSDTALTDGTIPSEELEFMRSLPPEHSPIPKEARIGTLVWIRNIAMALGVGQSFDKDLISAALSIHPKARLAPCKDTAYHPCDVLLIGGLVDANLDYHEGDMDLLQLSIHAQCSLKVMKFLLSKGLCVHSRAAAQSGNTMLHDALLSRSPDRPQIVQLLVQEGADYKHTSGEGLTILEASLEKTFYGSRRGPSPNLDMFIYLFEAGAPVRLPRSQVKERDPLLLCRLIAAGADDDLIFRALDAGAELNGRAQGDSTKKRMTPLEAAIRQGREELARELIRRGAEVNTPADDVDTHTALQTACKSNRSLQFIEYLVREQRVDVNEAPAHKYGHTALQGAAYCGSLSLTELLLAHGADVNGAPARITGFSALQRAAMCGCLAVAEILLTHGADVNALSGDIRLLYTHFGWTERKSLSSFCRALDCAAMTGRLDMVEFLLKAGGRSGTSGLDGAIAIAEAEHHFAIVLVLLGWKDAHGSIIIQEEAQWQQQNPASARMLLEPGSHGELSVGSAPESTGRDSLGRNLDD